MKSLILLILPFCFLSCNNEAAINANQLGRYGVNVTTVTIDSCEYVVAEEFQKAISIIHKQNCKFCAERLKQQQPICACTPHHKTIK